MILIEAIEVRRQKRRGKCENRLNFSHVGVRTIQRQHFPVEIDSVKLSQMELKATQTQDWNPYKLTVLINIRMSAQQSQSLPLPRPP
jgi:hypothetical protein